MKKLLIISSLYPSKFDPVRGVFVEKQVQELSRFFQIKVFATKARGKETFYKSVRNDIECCYQSYDYPFTIISPIYYYFAVRKKLLQLIEEFEPDIIHVHDFRHYPEVFVLSRILDFSKHKIFLTLHNNKLLGESRPKTYRFYKLFFKAAITSFSKIIVVSKKVELSLLRSLPSLDNIVILGNGTAPTSPVVNKELLIPYMPAEKSAFNILSVGNLVETKGFDILIKAVMQLHDDNITVTIIGDGDKRIELEHLINTHQLSGKVRLMGAVEHEIIMNLYSYYDAFVLPSWSETFGIVYLEAMLNGLPCLGIKGEGIDGIIIEGVNGYLAEPKSIDSISAKIKEIITASDLNEVTKTARKTVEENYLLSRIIDRLKELYLAE